VSSVFEKAFKTVSRKILRLIQNIVQKKRYNE